MQSIYHKALLIGSALGAVLAGPAFAADPDRNTSTVEEVTVTAEKRVDNVQDVPISITTYSADQLREQGATKIEDIAFRTPSMAVSGYDGPAGTPRVMLRGIGSAIPGIGTDPNVGIYIDEVYVSRPNILLADFLDVERVEVLLGPQGTLYGRNATGGLVNIVSQRPTADFTFTGDAEVGNYRTYKLRSSINGRVTDNLNARASVIFSRADSYVDNLLRAHPPRMSDAAGARLAFDWKPASFMDVYVGLEHYRDEASASFSLKLLDKPNNLLGSAGLPGYPAYTVIADPYKVKLDTDPRGLLTEDGVHARVNFELGGGYELTSLTGVRGSFTDRLFDSDGTEFPILVSQSIEKSQTYSQELRLASPRGETFEWLLGANYYHETGRQILFTRFPYVDQLLGLPSPFLYSIFRNHIETDAYAVFGTAYWHLIPDRLRLEVGVRSSWETKNHESKFAGTAGAAGIVNPPAVPETTGEADWSATTPKIGLQYFVDPDVMLYATVSEGFKSGGFNSLRAPSAAQPQLPFGPESIRSYEVGIKSDLLDKRLRVNAALFHYDYDNLQIAVNYPGTVVVENAAKASANGAELSILAVPDDHWRFELGGNWIDATFDNPSTAGNANTGTTQSIAGKQLPATAKFKMNAAVQYTQPLSVGSLTARLEAQYQSKVYFDFFNSANRAQDGYTLTNVRVAWTSPDGKWEVAGFGRNIFDKQYSVFIYQTPQTGRIAVYGRPATWGAQLAYRF